MSIIRTLAKLFGGGAANELARVRTIVFVRTAQGNRELNLNEFGLDVRLRGLLKAADGARDGGDLLALTQSLGVDEVSLLKLVAWGHIESTDASENQRLDHLISTMDGLEPPEPKTQRLVRQTISFKVLDAKQMAEEAARLDLIEQRRKQASAAQQRKQTTVAGLDVFGMQLVADLKAQGIVVSALEEAYPHLINRLGLASGHPAEFIAMLDGLMIDDRGGREGFPPAVMRDINGLRAGFIEHFVPPGQRDALLGVTGRLK